MDLGIYFKNLAANKQEAPYGDSEDVCSQIGEQFDRNGYILPDSKLTIFPVLEQGIKFRDITAENLKLKYMKLFSKSISDIIFKRLEEEIIYYTGNLLKIKVFGKWHDIPRKQVAFGDSGLTYAFSGNCIPAELWNDLTMQLRKIVENATGENYNFVLINRYKDGNDHIGEHRDDEKDLVLDAPIASLSFGQPRKFVFRHKDSRGIKAKRKINPVKMELEHGSLLIMESPTNRFWYHSLPKSKSAKNVRINLTFRKIAN